MLKKLSIVGLVATLGLSALVLAQTNLQSYVGSNVTYPRSTVAIDTVGVGAVAYGETLYVPNAKEALIMVNFVAITDTVITKISQSPNNRVWSIANIDTTTAAGALFYRLLYCDLFPYFAVDIYQAGADTADFERPIYKITRP